MSGQGMINTVVDITFRDDCTFTKVIDAYNLRVIKEQLYTGDNMPYISAQNVILVLAQCIDGDDVKSRETVNRLCEFYNAKPFYADMTRMWKETGYYPDLADSVRTYDKCMYMLNNDHSPAVDYIRPYMCEFSAKDIDVIRLTNPLRCMYRYVDLCNFSTSMIDDKAVISPQSSIIEVCNAYEELNDYIIKGIYTIQGKEDSSK